METQINKKQKTEVAAVFNACTANYLETPGLCSNQKKAIGDIVSCRTVKLGGHMNTCNQCGFTAQAFGKKDLRLPNTKSISP